MVDCQIEMNRIPNELVTPDYWDLHVSDDKSNFEAVGGVVKMRLIGCIFSSQNMALNPMTKIQEGIDNRTSTFQYNKYIKSMGSFQSKLSADAQQTILEFLSDDKSVKAVCRPFKRHIKKNQIRDMRSWRETIAQRQPPFSGTTWIVDPNRDVLTAEEILNGFKGPCISLLDARARMEPGDKVVLCEGHHEWYSNEANDPHDSFGDDECVYIEGIGECCLWFNAYHEHGFYGKLSLCNIQIRYDNPSPYPYTMLLEFFDSACIFMTNCVLDAVKICMYHDSTLNCIRCSFTDKSEQFLICGEHRSSLTMVDCQIEMNRIPNEVVTSDYWDLHVSDDKSKFESLGGAVTMQFIGCIFSSQNMALNPMTKIQEGIDQKTSTFQYNKYIKSRQASLQSKLSADAQQTILQFLSDDKSVKAVSKLFKEHIKKNQIRDMRSWRTTVAQRQPPFKGTTWIVDPNRNVLTAEENQNGFRGPCISLLDARARMESGDKVLLCEGHHEWYSNEANDPHDSFGDDECVYIEGIGECYIWFNAQHEHRFYGKLSFSNVHIRYADISPYPYSMLLEIHGEGASVFMSDCILDGVKLCVYDQATLNCIRCSFTDKSKQLEIYGEKRSSLTMVDCQIEMNRIPNKVVTPDYWNLHESDDKSNFEANGGAVTMRLIGCIFSSQNMALNPMTKIQEGIDKRTSTFQYNKYIKSR